MSINYEKVEQDIVILTMNMAGRSVNVINETFLLVFQQILQRLAAEELLAGVILTSAKKTFMAGCDLDWLVQLDDAAEAFDAAEEMKAAFRKLELLGIPVAAAINGTALGSGLEIALACNYRVALDDCTLKLGFPEVKLGLLPGGGGVTRLTRLLGLQKALLYLMEGIQVGPKAAKSAGFIDELASDQADLMARATAWILDNPAAAQPWDMPHFRLPGGAPTNPRVAQMLAVAPAMLKKKTYGNYPAPEAIMNAVVEGAMVDFDTACRIESRYFAKIAAGKCAKNMINAFWFQLKQINSGENRPLEIPAGKTKKVGVLGAGMMGHGIAYVTAYAGLEVILKDISLEKAEAGKTSGGFYTSRVFTTYVKEGLALLQEGQHPRAIESAGLKAGMPIGPLAIADEVSLSLMAQINEQTRQDLATEGQTVDVHPADAVLQIMTEQFGRLGKAHGAGFYEYPPSKPKHLWPLLHSLFPREDGKLSQHDMIERLMFIQALESVRCYEEGVVQSVADANIGSIFGWGFAPFKGGTLQYINDYGVGSFTKRSRQLAKRCGHRFEPSSLLEKMASSGQEF